MSFGFFSLLAMAAAILDLPLAATVLGCLGSISGLFMTPYTGALLAATSTPLWAAAPGALAVRFAASAIASAAAALSITQWFAGRFELCRSLGTLAMLALALELIASAFAGRRCRTVGVDAPLHERPW